VQYSEPPKTDDEFDQTDWRIRQIDRLKEVIERQRQDIKYLIEGKDRQRQEIARLEAEVKRLSQRCAVCANEYQGFCKAQFGPDTWADTPGDGICDCHDFQPRQEASSAGCPEVEGQTRQTCSSCRIGQFCHREGRGYPDGCWQDPAGCPEVSDAGN